MTALLALRSGLLVEVEADGAALASDRAQHVLLGVAYAALIPLLDGTRSEAEVLESCAADLDVQSVLTTLRRLRLWGILEERSGGEGGTPRTSGAVVAEKASPGETSGRSLPAIALDIVGDLDARTWIGAFERRGFPLDPDAATRITLTDSYLRPDLARPTGGDPNAVWLPVRPVGSEVWIGPTSGPGRGPCFDCVRDRLLRNRPVEAYLFQRQGRSPSVLHPPQPDRAVAFIADTLLAEPDPTPTPAIRSMDGVTGRIDRHALLLGPCPHGGDSAVGREEPGRTRPRDLEELLDPFTGIVRGLRPLDTGISGSVQVFEATFSGRPGGPGLAALRRSLKTASGKGRTESEARSSALGEAIERHCAVFRGDEPRHWASLSDLGDDALHPNACQLFSEAQFAGREAWNRRNRRYNQVPRPFDPDARCEWSPVQSLTRDRELLLPTALLYDDYPQRDDDAFAWFDPNGTSAGPTPEAAVLGGLLEVIERDAVAIWWYNRLSRPEVPHDAPQYEELCRSLGREYWVLDLTTDLGIPVFAAVSRRIDLPTERPLFGFGCHPDSEIALQKALLEMVQVLVLVRDADRGPQGVGLALESWLRTASVENERFLAPSGGTPSTGPGPVGRPLDRVRQAVEGAGLDILKLDLTRGDVGIPVVTMIVPGLRSFYARFAPGRLFDVPVSLGWLREPSSESILNAIPFLL